MIISLSKLKAKVNFFPITLKKKFFLKKIYNILKDDQHLVTVTKDCIFKPHPTTILMESIIANHLNFADIKIVSSLKISLLHFFFTMSFLYKLLPPLLFLPTPADFSYLLTILFLSLDSDFLPSIMPSPTISCFISLSHLYIFLKLLFHIPSPSVL